MVARYAMKASIVEAVQYDTDPQTMREAVALTDMRGEVDYNHVPPAFAVPVLQGKSGVGGVPAEVGDWIVRLGNGALEVYDPGAFRAKYERVEVR